MFSTQHLSLGTLLGTVLKMKPFILFLIISSNLICSCFAEENDQAVDKLIQKICTVARDKLQIQTASPQERKTVLNAMREKLKKTSDSLGLQSTAHIRLIIQGVTILAIEENYQKLCIDKAITTADRRAMYKELQKTEEAFANSSDIGLIKESTANKFNYFHGASDANMDSFFSSNVTSTSNSTGIDVPKVAEIKLLTDKMQVIMNKSIKDGSTAKEKREVAEKLKHQFIEAFRRAYHNSKKLNTYITLVEKGMDVAVEKLVKSDLPKTQLDNNTLIATEALAEVPKPQQSKDTFAKVQHLRKVMDHLANPSSHMLTTTSASITISRMQGVTKDYGCSDIIKETCVNLKGLDKFMCDYDGTTISTQQVCDGNIDCPDGSDEKNCIQQVIGKIHSATQVMAKVEMSRSCFKSIIDNSLISKQGELLSKLLNSQVEFLKKYTIKENKLSSMSTTRKRESQPQILYRQSINEIAYEIGVIVRSFASTLINALCISTEKMQKDLDDLVGMNFDKEMEEVEIKSRTKWLPSLCRCNKQYCENVTSCDPRCKRFCYQIHSLQNFNCQSIKKGQNSVPLDFVCDGKLDCSDETDELQCPVDESMSKFKGRKIFDEIINIIKARTMTKEFSMVRVEMVELQVCIQSLQKRSVTHKTDISLLKNYRDKCFKKLGSIYEMIIEEGDLSKLEQEGIYDYLQAVSEKMIKALKQTHMGNKNIISSVDCFCRGAECAQANCPQRCIKACVVKSLLTNYNCSSSSNVSVPIDAICNGKINCPNAEDELNCKTDICRTHHLKVIRRNINSLSVKYHGSSIGDVLDKWKTKVTSHLLVLEKRERLTPKLFKQTVSQILNDLSLTYSAPEQTRRRHDDTSRLRKFAKLSQHVMNMLKECNK